MAKTTSFVEPGALQTPAPLAAQSDSAVENPSLRSFLLLPAVAMSLGWGLRGTIGGGQIGAMIPGVIVTLCLCHLIGWSRSLGIVAAFGTVGVGLGGQETYGQTIGFIRESATMFWGFAGLTIKGAMWGLSGGVLVGLGLMHEKYRRREIIVGLLLMIAATVLGRMFVDEPRWIYFSNRADKPREELWFGLTIGALSLVAYLALLRREKVSLAFAWGGMLAGGAGFGLGGLFNTLGHALPPPYRSWPWWKAMEFSFGLLYGLGLGAVCYRHRDELRGAGAGESELSDEESVVKDRPELLRRLPTEESIVVALALVVGGLWFNFSVPYRAVFSILAPALIVVALYSNRLAWQIALSMTACGFVRDFIRRGVEQQWLDPLCESWAFIALVSLPVVAAIAYAERNGRLASGPVILGMTWIATLFGLAKVGLPTAGKDPHIFVPAVFIVEAIATTVFVLAVPSAVPSREASLTDHAQNS